MVTKTSYGRRVRYDLSAEGYDLLLQKQGGVCAICGQPERLKSTNGSGEIAKDLSVDHCHDTGQIRGLLCRSCNFALGHMEDDPHRFRVAAQYLENSLKNVASLG